MVLQKQLLTTKLYIPRVRAHWVSRPHLIAQLNQALTYPLTLISAPPGFGKTTLLSEWVNQKDEENLPPFKVAWLSLDEADNDPMRFFGYFIEALQTVQMGIGQSMLAALRAQPQAFSIEPEHEVDLLLPLINEISAFAAEAEMVLVLDDYHIIDNPVIHRAIACLLDYLPPQMHLIITSRTDPPLPLPRLRVRQQLLELRAPDLRFTSDETATFLNQVMGLHLSPADVSTLETRTEGWIAGLQLAALSMQACDDVSNFIASFTGSHRYVFDYLAEEVLNQQSHPVQEFLLQTSILNRLTAPLCGELVEGADAQRMLEYLEQANLFIIPLDDERRWYRYHHLFVDFLRSHLRRQMDIEKIMYLHCKAAAWYEQNDLAAEAVGHALFAADIDRAVRLVEQSGKTMLLQSELSTLLQWLQALPEEMTRTRPRLSLFHAWALVFTGQLVAAEEWLQQIDLDSAEVDVPGELTALQATLSFFRRDFPQSIRLYREAFEQLPEENLFLRGAVSLSLATAYNLQGDIIGAKWAFEQAGLISRANDNVYMTLLAMCNLAQLHVAQAQLHRAAELYRQALQMVAESSVRLANAGRAYVGLGQILYQWNDLPAAADHLQQGIAWGQQYGDTITLMQGYLALAQLEHAQGNPDAAFAAINNADKHAQSHNLSSWEIRLVAARVVLWLAQDDVDAAIRQQEKNGDTLDQAQPTTLADDSAGYPDELHCLEQLTQTRLLLAQNSPDDALEILAPLLQLAQTAGRTECVLEIWVLQAAAYHALQDMSQAMVVLEQALRDAAPEEYIRLFVDGGSPIKALLKKINVEDKEWQGYTDKLLAAFEQTKKTQGTISTDQVDPLSERELELLGLIANGMSNQQISETLFLTVGTVKWHLSNIYSKLGVSSRTQAVARARDLELL